MTTKPKILYVDDEKTNLLLFEANFEDDYTVITAINGFDGLKLLDGNTDTFIIISDMKMPGMNGLDFIKKAKEKYPNKKYYILTSFEITHEIREGLDVGIINEYFSKPFEIEKMYQVFEKALKQ